MIKQSNNDFLQTEVSKGNRSSFKLGVNDLRGAIREKHIFMTLGWQDVKARYRRSRVGAFWLTINMGVLIAVLGIIFGSLFRAPIETFLPSIAIGIIVWGLLSVTVSESCDSFSSAKDTILQVKMPLSIHIIRVAVRNLIIFGHNALIIPIIFIIFVKPIDWISLYALLGLFLLILNITWMSFVLSIVCTRFRDVTEIIKNLMQVMFYATPIIWEAEMLPQRISEIILNFNPFYHLITIIRAPLLGQMPTFLNWVIPVSMAIIGWGLALTFFGYYKKRVAYWL